MMSVRQARRLLIVANILAVATAAAAGLGSLWAPVPSPPARNELPRPAAVETPASAAGKRLSLSDWEPLWRQSLRRPLVDPVPTAVSAPPPKPTPRPKLSVRVIGTILEPGLAVALLQVGNGEVQLRKEGEALEGVVDCRVLAIAANTVRLQHLDQEVVLELLPDRP